MAGDLDTHEVWGKRDRGGACGCTGVRGVYTDASMSMRLGFELRVQGWEVGGKGQGFRVKGQELRV